MHGEIPLDSGGVATPVFMLMTETYMVDAYSPDNVASTVGISATRIRQFAADLADAAFAKEVVINQLVDNNLLGKGGISQVCGKLANTRCGNADCTRHIIWGISVNHIGFRHQHKDRGCHTARV